MQRVLEGSLLLLLSACASAPQLKKTALPVSHRALASVVTKQADETRINEALTDVARSVVEVQVALRQGRIVKALALTDLLQQRYPGVKYLSLLRASTLTALGAHQAARETLESVLKDFPNDPAAQQLKEALAD